MEKAIRKAVQGTAGAGKSERAGGDGLPGSETAVPSLRMAPLRAALPASPERLPKALSGGRLRRMPHRKKAAETPFRSKTGGALY